MANYFGFAMSSSMFSDGAICSMKKITPDEARAHLAHWEADKSLKVCLNPSHAATIAAMAIKYGISVEIPAAAPRCSLENGDNLLVLQVGGLPRLGADRHEYTNEEIAKASFSFDLWHVGGPCQVCGGSPTDNCLDCPFFGL